MKEEVRLLSPVPKTIGFKIKVIVLGVLWFFYQSENKKNKKEFYYGLIDHQCDFDNKVVHKDKNGSFYKCKHYGCGVIWPLGIKNN